MMKAGSVLVNVARGEIVDEEALLDALRRDHLRGAILDVYVGEFERPPMPLLWSDRRVLIMPHISNGSDHSQHGGIDVFCSNLRAYRETAAQCDQLATGILNGSGLRLAAPAKQFFRAGTTDGDVAHRRTGEHVKPFEPKIIEPVS
jgi:hypothetical protein